MKFKGSGWRRLLDANVGKGGGAPDPLQPGIVSELSVFHFRPGGSLSVWVEIFGEGAENSTINYVLWGVNPIFGRADGELGQAGRPAAYRRMKLGEGTATLSTQTGDGVVIPGAMRIADTITFTASDKGQVIVDAYQLGDDAVHSPGMNDDDHATLVKAFKGLFEFYELELTPDTADSANALVLAAGDPS